MNYEKFTAVLLLFKKSDRGINEPVILFQEHPYPASYFCKGLNLPYKNRCLLSGCHFYNLTVQWYCVHILKFFKRKSFNRTGFLFPKTVYIMIEQYKSFLGIINMNAVRTVTIKSFLWLFLIIFHYNTGFDNFNLQSSASMIRQNVLIPGSTIPFSILEI